MNHKPLRRPRDGVQRLGKSVVVLFNCEVAILMDSTHNHYQSNRLTVGNFKVKIGRLTRVKLAEATRGHVTHPSIRVSAAP